MASTSPPLDQPDKKGCTHVSLRQAGAISLPVLPGHASSGKIRKSKNSRRRAIVLIIVQLLIIVHIVLWVLSKKYGWFGGYTITPIEPSESMEFSKYGVINAGLIFFAIALLSTLVLGRWFCGWGCHVVMLQDFCGWMMKKCGVRPKPFRSRLLIYVPLILAVYMFIMPAVHRWGLLPLDTKMAAAWGEDNWLVESMRFSFTTIGFPVPYQSLPEWKISSHLTTDDFWKTFATIGIAIPFLFICGFAVVYFLGAKGFCTYGCPYGGFFAPLDKLAPARILVTDACEGCGHCTAVCTSNVRVHEEVREYGMVVDPGCMKCLDCVSVCPNEALYFGFAKPAITKGAAKHAPPKRVYDLKWGEEIAFAFVFLLSFIAVRGVYGVVPMLMAVGIAGIVTFLTWKLWRIMREPNVTLHRTQLKMKNELTRAGWIFSTCVLAMIALTVHSGIVNAALSRADHFDRQVVVHPQAPFGADATYLTPELVANADRALGYYELGSGISSGGIGLLNTLQLTIDLKAVRLLVVKRDFVAAESLLQRAIARDGEIDELVDYMMWVLYGTQRGGEALTYGRGMLLKHEHLPGTLDTFVQFCSVINDTGMIVNLCRDRLELFPDDLKTLRWLSIVLLQTGSIDEAVAITRRTIEIDPNNGSAHYFLATGLMEMGKNAEALTAIRKAYELTPSSVPIVQTLANLLDANGLHEEAERYRQDAQQIQAEHLKRTSANQ